MIKGVYFDLDGIYFNRGMEDFIVWLSETYFIPKHTVEAVFKRSKEAHDYKAGVIPSHSFYDYANKIFGFQIPEREYVLEMAAKFSLNQAAYELSVRLKKAGIKTLLCANIFEDLLVYLNHSYRLLENFDVKIFSFNVHVLKPDILMYEALLEESKLAANQILYVDDDNKSCINARKLGFISHCSDQVEVIERLLHQENIVY
ncbi:MAG: hypothetical protein AAB443_00475 [Patescibacteria group bacterium]